MSAGGAIRRQAEADGRAAAYTTHWGIPNYRPTAGPVDAYPEDGRNTGLFARIEKKTVATCDHVFFDYEAAEPHCVACGSSAIYLRRSGFFPDDLPARNSGLR